MTGSGNGRNFAAVSMAFANPAGRLELPGRGSVSRHPISSARPCSHPSTAVCTPFRAWLCPLAVSSSVQGWVHTFSTFRNSSPTVWAWVLTHFCPWFLLVSYRETLIERTIRYHLCRGHVRLHHTLPQPVIEPTREQPCEQYRSPPTEHLLGTAERKGLLIAASLGLPTSAPKAEDTGACASWG